MYNAIFFKMLYGNTSTEGAEPAGGDNDGSEGQTEQKEAGSPCQGQSGGSFITTSPKWSQRSTVSVLKRRF